jgi:hypothetical protein
MGRELDGHGTRAKHPTKNNILRSPGGVTFQHLLDRRWLLSVGIFLIIKVIQHFIQGTE